MTREAFDLSERFHVPVLLRLVTRAGAQPRVGVDAPGARRPRPCARPSTPAVVDPAARQRAAAVAAICSTGRPTCGAWTRHRRTANAWSPGDARLGVDHDGRRPATTSSRTSRISDYQPSHLHIGAYPFPVGARAPARRRT